MDSHLFEAIKSYVKNYSLVRGDHSRFRRPRVRSRVAQDRAKRLHKGRSNFSSLDVASCSACFVRVKPSVLGYAWAMSRRTHAQWPAGSVAKIKKAGTLESYGGAADWLARRLEEVWHIFNNEKKNLMYPLGKNVIPDEIKGWTDKALWAFRLQYQSHIGALKKIDPEFHSPLIDDGFPCDGQDYLTVKRKIEAHANLLRKRAQELSSSAKAEYDQSRAREVR